MTQLIQKLVIAYAFFIFGMMGGFGYLNGYEYMLNMVFDYSSYQKLFLSALIALFVMGLIEYKKSLKK